MSLTDFRRGQDGSPAEMMDLFFKALFKLGVYAADWEVLYGTRPLSLPAHQRRTKAFHNPPNPNPGQ